MFKLSLCLLNVITYTFALHNFLPSEVAKKSVYTNFIPPSGERFFAPTVPSTKTQAQVVAPLLPAAAAGSPYFAPYAYQTQYSPYAYKQYPYYPGVFYPPQQQYVYPSPVGPSPVVYVPRYPAPAESGSEQGGSSGGAGGWGSYFPSNWQSWGSNWGSYFPSWPGSGPSEGAEGSTPGTPAEGSSSQAAGSPSTSNRGKPEKLEAAGAALAPTPTPTPTGTPSQDFPKSDGDADKNAVTVELPEQQYVLLGQPQFFGHFAAFPTDRDPATLNGAAKGAVSSFLFYKDQNQQVVPQRFDDIANVPGSASLAYQRFLLLSKQRSEDGPKPANKSESSPSSSPASPQNETSRPDSNSTAAAAVPVTDEATSAQLSSAKPSEDSRGAEIAQVTPNAVAYAGIGGVAGAAPVGTAFIANSGLASSAPRATAIAGTSNQSPDFVVVPTRRMYAVNSGQSPNFAVVSEPKISGGLVSTAPRATSIAGTPDQSSDFAAVPAKTISIARYTPQRKYHIDNVVHRFGAGVP